MMQARRTRVSLACCSLAVIVLLGVAGVSQAAKGVAHSAGAAECLQKLSDAVGECSTCLNSANKVAYQRLDRLFGARGNSAFRLDVPRFFHLAVGFSQNTVKAPMPCCKTAVLVFSQKFQEECACLPEVVQHTEHFDKELIDYYYDFLSSSCGFSDIPGTSPWNQTCGLSTDDFVSQAQEKAFSIPDWVDQIAGAGKGMVKMAVNTAGTVVNTAGSAAAGVVGGVTNGMSSVASGITGGVTGITSGIAGGVITPFGKRRRMQEGGRKMQEGAKDAGAAAAAAAAAGDKSAAAQQVAEGSSAGDNSTTDGDQGQCSAVGITLKVAQNTAAAPFYFLCPPTKGHCSTGKCIFGRTAAVSKGEWATCSHLTNCSDAELQLGGCFPGEATVKLPGGMTKRMRDLRVGDKVLAARPDGRLEFQDIYFFGHRSSEVTAGFVRIELDSGRALELTPDHFVPVAASGAAGASALVAAAALGAARMTYAHNVKQGDLLLVLPGDLSLATGDLEGLQIAQVIRTEAVVRRGLFNPYTMGGSIVVDGVLASAHSSWLIDGAAARLGASHLLPATFQALFAPLRALYALIGPEAMQAFGDALAESALALEAALLAPRGVAQTAAVDAPTAVVGTVAAAAATVVAAAGSTLLLARRRRQGCVCA